MADTETTAKQLVEGRTDDTAQTGPDEHSRNSHGRPSERPAESRDTARILDTSL